MNFKYVCNFCETRHLEHNNVSTDEHTYWPAWADASTTSDIHVHVRVQTIYKSTNHSLAYRHIYMNKFIQVMNDRINISTSGSKLWKITTAKLEVLSTIESYLASGKCRGL